MKERSSDSFPILKPKLSPRKKGRTPKTPPKAKAVKKSAPKAAQKSTQKSASLWKTLKKFQDILYEKTADGIAKITINRPEVRNAFRPADRRRIKRRFCELAREDAKDWRRHY